MSGTLNHYVSVQTTKLACSKFRRQEGRIGLVSRRRVQLQGNLQVLARALSNQALLCTSYCTTVHFATRTQPPRVRVPIPSPSPRRRRNTHPLRIAQCGLIPFSRATVATQVRVLSWLAPTTCTCIADTFDTERPHLVARVASLLGMNHRSTVSNFEEPPSAPFAETYS